MMNVNKVVFEHCFENYQRLVRYSISTFRLPQTEKDEILQETFLRYFNHMNQVPPEKTKAWLVVTAQNLAKDAHNKAKRRRTDICHETALKQECTLWNAETLCASSKEALSQLDEASKNLHVLRDFYMGGKAVKEIAKEKKMKTSSITAALTRERRELRLRVAAM
jgi:RNA polymerase sigma factor (sigma-70 family)